MQKKQFPAIIDVHSHPSIPLYHELVRNFDGMSDELRFAHRVFYPPQLPDWTPQWAVEVMDGHGIRAQVLSLPDATIGLRGDQARRVAREINEALARIVSDHPGRFGAYAVVPHDDAASTLAEIEHALDVLKLDGICTTTNVRGEYLGAPTFAPWLEELHRRRAVLFIHPTLDRSARYAAPLYIEFSFDSTRMVMDMVLSGAKRKYAGIEMISTHGGGTIPYLSHRLEQVEPLIGRSKLSGAEIAEDLRSFHYDLTSCMSDVPLAAATRFAGASKLLMGFDFPYAPVPLVGPEIARLGAFDGLDDVQLQSIASDNALRLFPRLAARM